MEQRVTAVTLGVADLARSRAFYEEGLGWRRANDHDEVAFYRLPGMILALFGREYLARESGMEAAATSGPTAFAGIALAHNCRSREDVDAVLAEAAAAGGTLLKPARDMPWGGYSGYFADPDGHLWEVAWNPGWPLDAEGRPSL